jgi:DNA ligase-1
MHGEDWDGQEDLTGWWMSEKMDGIRAYWNGEKLISKQARQIFSPEWFISELPKGIKLDGELWMGRETLDKLMTVMNSKDEEMWKKVKYVVFDMVVSNIDYETRIEELKKLKLPSHTVLIDIKRALGNNHLMEYLNEIVSDGGEGIVVTKPQSFYVPERTRTRMKVKVKHSIIPFEYVRCTMIVRCKY